MNLILLKEMSLEVILGEEEIEENFGDCLLIARWERLLKQEDSVVFCLLMLFSQKVMGSDYSVMSLNLILILNKQVQVKFEEWEENGNQQTERNEWAVIVLADVGFVVDELFELFVVVVEVEALFLFAAVRCCCCCLFSLLLLLLLCLHLEQPQR